MTDQDPPAELRERMARVIRVSSPYASISADDLIAAGFGDVVELQKLYDIRGQAIESLRRTMNKGWENQQALQARIDMAPHMSYVADEEMCQTTSGGKCDCWKSVAHTAPEPPK